MKERKPRSAGVRICYQAFCHTCGWNGAYWSTKGAASQAHAELQYHKEHAESKGRPCSKAAKGVA